MAKFWNFDVGGGVSKHNPPPHVRNSYRLHSFKNFSQLFAKCEYSLLLDILLLKIKPDGPCRRTVRTYRPVQCAAVRTQLSLIRLPPQIDWPPNRSAAWCGNWPGCASDPPIIFGAIDSGASSEIQMNPLVTISLTTKCTYIPTHRILH
jgi:hypothetical protein